MRKHVRQTIEGDGMETKDRVVQALRWIAIAPAAFLAATLAQLAVIVLNRLSPGDVMNSILGDLFIRTVGNGAFGAVAILTAAVVAPKHKSVVAIFSAGVLLALFAVQGIHAVAVGSGWDVYSLVMSSVGCVGASVYIYLDQGAHSRAIESAHSDSSGQVG